LLLARIPQVRTEMQLLAGIQRPIPTVQTSQHQNQEISYVSLCLKTVKLTLVLMKRADMTIFSRHNFEMGPSKRRLALTCGLFMLIRASKMNVSGLVVEKALGSLEKLDVLDLWGLRQLVSGSWEFEHVINILDNAVLLKILTEWRLASKGQARLNNPLDFYISHLTKVPAQKLPDQKKKSLKLGDYELLAENFDEQEQDIKYQQVFSDRLGYLDKKRTFCLFRAWRLLFLGRILRRKQALSRFFGNSRTKISLIKKRLRTAGVLNKMNFEKRLFHSWLLKTKKMRYIEGKAATMRCFQEKKVIFDKWRSKSKPKFLVGKFLGKWRRRLSSSKAGMGMSIELLKTRLKEACLQIWLRKLHLVRSSEERLVIYKRIAGDHVKANVLFKFMRLIRLQRQQEKRFIEWKEGIIRRNIFKLMRNRTRQLLIGRDHYCRGLKYGALLAWRNALKELEYSKENRSRLFIVWKKCSLAKQGLKAYFRSKLLNRIASYHPSNAIWDQLSSVELRSFAEMNGLGNVTKCFLHWKHRTRRQRKLRTLQKEFIDARNLKFFQKWHSEAIIRSAHRREPSVLRLFFLQKWRTNLAHLREKDEARGVRLADYQVGREYILLYTAFKQWEQLFEVKKIEEHLCEQNLVVWDMRKKEFFMKKFRLEALIRIFKKFDDQLLRKDYFERWQNLTKQEEEERIILISGKYFEQWRRQLEISKARQVSRTFAKRRLERCFVKFKRVLKIRGQFIDWANEINELNLKKRFYNAIVKKYRLKKNSSSDENPFIYNITSSSDSIDKEEVVTTQPLISLSVQNRIKVAEEELKLTEWFGNGSGPSAFDEISNDIFFTPIKSVK
jgi:hypothetical protein